MMINDIFEDYVASLQNLPTEIDQSMHNLRTMDEEFQRLKETYSKHKKAYTKMLRSSTNSTPTTPSASTPLPSPTPPVSAASLTTARHQVDEDYKIAVQKQEQKISCAKDMYELVSRRIEQIDQQMAKSGISDLEWIGQREPLDSRKNTGRHEWFGDGPRKRSSRSGPHFIQKRTHHSSRPVPIGENGTLAEQDIDPNEPRYCYCNQVSYGDMIACDGKSCEKEWFHYGCVGLKEPPVGTWYCNGCAEEEGLPKQYEEDDGDEDEDMDDDDDDEDDIM